MKSQPILHGLTGKQLHERDTLILQALEEIRKELEQENKNNK